MKTLERVVFAAGLVAFAILLWTMDAAAAARLVLDVGVGGIALILSQEVIAHVLNAAGWRLAFPATEAAAVRFRDLFKLRVVGDAVNYLTPSATIAGEFTRATMLSGPRGPSVRAAAVLVAKCTQTLAQVLFVVIGLVVVTGAHLPFVRSYEGLVYWIAVVVAAALVAVAVYELRIALPPPAPAGGPTSMGPRALAGWLRHFFRLHPGRFSASTLLFMLGYAWGGFEAYWICRFLGVHASVGTAMTIEVLSVTLDSLLFIVPAKMGIQEGGKTAIFAALGLPATSGLAFGVVRHLRELIWAGSGLLIYSVSRRPPADPRPAVDSSVSLPL